MSRALDYDPTGARHNGMPTYPYRLAPADLATRRQLRARGLRPGRQPIAAQLVWRRGARVAYLYRLDLARPAAPFTAARRRALDLANAARRRCPTCHADAGYVIPPSVGQCNRCDGIPAESHDPAAGFAAAA